MKSFTKLFLIPSLIAFSMFALISLSLYAQAFPQQAILVSATQSEVPTNTTTAFLSATPAPPDVVQVHNASEAFAALLHFSGVSGTTITLIFIVLHLLARTLRNTMLKNCSPDTAGIVTKIIAIAGGKPLEMSTPVPAQPIQPVKP